MNDLHKHKSRMSKLRKIKNRSHLSSVPSEQEVSGNQHLKGDIDSKFVERIDASTYYSDKIRNLDTSVSKAEVNALLKTLDDDIDPMDHILEPVFLSLFDGTMRAFKVGAKQGITASRLYGECKSFSYDNPNNSIMLDSYTEHLNEKENIATYGDTATYNKGKISRHGIELNMRDGKKMGDVKDRHFQGEHTATDGYGGSKEIYESGTHAKGVDKKNQSTEIDHVVPCAEICNNLKKNKALTDTDIKDIINIDENLMATSMENNRGSTIGKFDKSQVELQKEVDQGFVNESGDLTSEQLEVRKNMVGKMEKAQGAMDKKTNQKVINNLKGNKDVQKRMATDASDAAANQSLGDVIIFMIKPLYYELKDCFINGIEEGVDASSFKAALSIRVTRMKNFVIEQAGNVLKNGVFSFFKNFVSMLLEGIVNCFVGVFKSIFRIVKEGFKALMQIVPILRDKNKSMAEKGDAILKLAASSLTIFASIGIESWLNSAGLGEPLSIIISSVLTAILTALTMYLLDKVDIFGLKEEARLSRIDEILSLRIEETKDEMFSMVRALS